MRRAIRSSRCAVSLPRSHLRSSLAGAGRSVTVRIVTLPATAFFALLTTRLVVHYYSAGAYATFALVISLPALIPIADLGLGTAVTDAIARRDILGDEPVAHVLRKTALILASFGLVFAILATLCGALNLWPSVVGSRVGDVDLAVTVAMVVFGISLPATLGYRVLLGLEKQHIAVLLQGVSGGLVAVAVATASVLRLPVWTLYAFPAAMQAVAGAIACRWAWSTGSVPALRLHFSRSKPRSPMPHGSLSLALPAAIIAAALPLALQSDRLVLSHMAGLDAVARYSSASQVFSPLLSLVLAGGMSLWPTFLRRRALEPDAFRGDYMAALRLFTVGGVGLALALALISPPLTAWVTDGRAGAPLSLGVAFAVLLTIYSVHMPSGMLNMDLSGLRFQAGVTCVMLLVNLPLSLFLAREMGASGPVWASSASMLCCVLFPTLIRSLRIVQAGPNILQ